MRLSRTCYDKAHRCPGWAGGGVHTAKTDRYCCNGYITVHRFDESGHWGHPAQFAWSFGHCNRCDVVTWPVVTRWLDRGWWGWVLHWKRQAVKDWLYDWGRR